MSFTIMAGGSGTRFWPVSRRKCPKQFLKIVSEEPMVVDTYNRIRPLAKDDREIFIVVGSEHEEIAKEFFAGTKVNIVVEPIGRNTAPCIGLAAIVAQSKGLDEAMAILPSDHYVALPDVFRRDLSMAMDLANKESCIVTLGILPTRPETGYGYIEVVVEGGALEVGKAFSVRSFKEKPDLSTARHYIASGRYLWNAGIFVAKPSVILNELSHSLPDFYLGLEKLKTAMDSPNFYALLNSLYQQAPNISFDYAVMERAKVPIFVIPSSCGWSDVGSWFSCYELKCQLKKHSEDGNISEGEVWFFSARENFVHSQTSRSIVLLGVSRLLVVDTNDALLIADLDRHQEIRKITEHFSKSEKHHLI
ncbi:MAG: sugar phosphate nucleotidyltransferase [Syntrophobacterales bacterium]|nr:sugar phosphate nucleotidyltransferase [Syntrophobacterales bacterium]